MKTNITIPSFDQELDLIKSFLDRHVTPDLGELKNFSKQLKKIDRSLETTLNESRSAFLRHSAAQQQKLVKALSGRCHQLGIRKEVIDMAENAEELANSSPGRSHDDVAREADALRLRIDTFLKDHRLSQTNTKFLRFAKACLAKAERGEPVIVKKRVSLESFQRAEVTPESYELAEGLYELSSILYQGDVEGFQGRFNTLPEVTKKELSFHIDHCKGDLAQLQKRKHQLYTIQAILGYAHLVTDYYADITPYPTIIEIHSVFEDLDFIKHSEETPS